MQSSIAYHTQYDKVEIFAKFVYYTGMKIILQADEKVLYSGAANHYVNHILMVGKLYLTNQTLTFIARPQNFRKYSFSIPLRELIEVEFRYKLKIFSHGIWLHHNNQVQHFAVWRRRRWKKAIEQAIHHYA